MSQAVSLDKLPAIIATQPSPAAAIPAPTPENTHPCRSARPASASALTQWVPTRTRTQALATPAIQRSASQNQNCSKRPIASVARPIAMSDAARSARGDTGMRAAVNAPIR